jgi:hypothetical protein
MSYFHYHLVVELSATFQVVACVSSEYRPCIRLRAVIIKLDKCSSESILVQRAEKQRLLGLD